MSNKILGYLLCLFGLFFLLLSFFTEYFKGIYQDFGLKQNGLLVINIDFGLKQIALSVISVVIICFGVFLLRGFKIYQAFKASEKIPPYQQIAITIIFSIVMAILLIYPLQFVVKYLSFPFPFEYRDAASIYAAVGFSKGVNPYSLQNFPGHIYLYGLLYPVMLMPFVNLIHPLLAAAAINVVFLILFLIMSFWIFRKRHASIISSLIGLLILLNSTCLIWKNNGSRPDMPGLFFALLGLCFLLKREPGIIRILLCALSCVISFYLKQYMIFSALVVAVYLYFFVSKQKGYIFIATTLALGLVSFLVIRSFFPLYYEYSIMHHITVAGDYPTLMEEQTLFFLFFYWVLFLIYLFHLYKEFRTFGLKRLKKSGLCHLIFKSLFFAEVQQICSMLA